MKKIVYTLLTAVSLSLSAACETDTDGLIPYLYEEQKTENPQTPSSGGSVTLNVDAADCLFEAAGESKSFTVTSNVAWTASADDETWLKFDRKSGSGNGSFTITVGENTSTSQRSTTVRVMANSGGNGKSYSFTATQRGSALVLEVSPTTWSIGAVSEQKTFEVTSNIDWTVSADDESWITFDKKSGSGNGTFTITALANTTTESRTTIIRVKSNGNGNAKTVVFNIVQQGKSSQDPFNGHSYVDLGLKDAEGRTIYWATCNVGGSKPEDAGLYFAWGETQGYGSNTNDGHTFDWAHYTLCSGTETTMKKYCTASQYGKVDNKTVLDPEDDAAHVNWGGSWRMPTKAEQDQLREKCKWTWGGTKKGYTVKGPNGQSIFLPAAGYRDDSDLNFAGSIGYFWSSSLDASGSDDANYLYFDSSYVDWNDNYRCRGRSVRAVCVFSE